MIVSELWKILKIFKINYKTFLWFVGSNTSCLANLFFFFKIRYLDLHWRILKKFSNTLSLKWEMQITGFYGLFVFSKFKWIFRVLQRQTPSYRKNKRPFDLTVIKMTVSSDSILLDSNFGKKFGNSDVKPKSQTLLARIKLEWQYLLFFILVIIILFIKVFNLCKSFTFYDLLC